MRFQISNLKSQIGRGIAAVMLLVVACARTVPTGTAAESAAVAPEFPHMQPTTSATLTTQPAVWAGPVSFARGGRSAEVLVFQGNMAHESMTLFAYGRSWMPSTAPVPVAGREGNIGWARLRITAPAVRVPTTFSACPDLRPNLELGQLVVYPDQDIRWDKRITLYSLDAPDWFRQWTRAVGLPVAPIEADASPQALRHEEDGRALLIVGFAGGRTVPKIAEQAKALKVNILALDDSHPVGISRNVLRIDASAMAGGLADLVTQRWGAPLRFCRAAPPWAGKGNRWPWMGEAVMPLIEQIALAQDHPPVILDHVPWYQQLGRNEVADEVFLRVLRAAAETAPPQLDRPVKMFWPSTWPWLTEGVRYAKDRTDSVVVIMVDGSSFPNDDVWNTRKTVQGNPVIVLGDHPRLDEWEWLKLDRKTMRAGREGVLWLPNFRPGNEPDRLRLMLKLTELGVPLAPPAQEEKQK